jgi:hypothetical protein
MHHQERNLFNDYELLHLQPLSNPEETIKLHVPTPEIPQVARTIKANKKFGR